MVFGPTYDPNSKSISFSEMPEVPLSPTQLRVEVHYAGLNRADVQQSKGVYPPPPGESEILGLECSGVVREIGRDVVGFRLGDRVMCLVGGGAFGTLVAAEQNQTFLVPTSMSMQEAATVPESLFTFWVNAVMEGGLEKGKSFLIHGGAAGLGSFSILMAKALGAKVASSARGQERTDFVRGLGADAVVNTEGKSLEQLGAELKLAGGFDMILDHIGVEYFALHLSLLNRLGKLILINNVSPDAFAQIDVKSLVFKRLTVQGSLLRSRTATEKNLISADIRARALPFLSQEKFTVPIDHVFDVQDFSTAVARLESRKNLGKIVLKVGSPGSEARTR